MDSIQAFNESIRNRIKIIENYIKIVIKKGEFYDIEYFDKDEIEIIEVIKKHFESLGYKCSNAGDCNLPGLKIEWRNK